MGHSVVVFIERWSLYTGESTWIHGCSHFGTCPSGLYREVVLIKGCLIRQVSLYMYLFVTLIGLFSKMVASEPLKCLVGDVSLVYMYMYTVHVH